MGVLGVAEDSVRIAEAQVGHIITQYFGSTFKRFPGNRPAPVDFVTHAQTLRSLAREHETDH